MEGTGDKGRRSLKQRSEKNHIDMIDDTKDCERESYRTEAKQKGNARSTHHELSEETSDSDDELEINRSPVLTLWVSVVAERLGFSREEAYTYGRWVASSLAATRDREVEAVQPVKKKARKNNTGKHREDFEVDANHVNVFAQMKIPVKKKDGKRYAIMVKQDREIKPETVRRYLEKKFGEKLDTTYDAMMDLAQSMDADDVRNRAYELFGEFKPETNRRGAKGMMDLDRLHRAADKIRRK